MKLHLGCGPNVLDGWTNLDAEARPGVTPFDLRRPLPFASSSVTCIYSEHFIEHISRPEGVSFLSECRRVLRPGGRLRISTPDLTILAEDYLAARTDRWKALGWQPSTPCQLVNEGMRAWGHSFLYDAHELDAAFREAGLSGATRVAWRHSDVPDLCGLETRPSCRDLIVEGHKGAW